MAHEKVQMNLKCILLCKRRWFHKAKHLVRSMLWHNGKGKIIELNIANHIKYLELSVYVWAKHQMIKSLKKNHHVLHG